jgi:hypothetical protein
MSVRVVNPRPMITVKALAAELLLAREQILPSIIELKDMRSDTVGRVCTYLRTYQA